MATYANSALTQSDAVVYGSMKIEISTDSGVNWTNVGLARSVVFQENIDVAAIQADNGPDLDERIADHTALITFNGLEFYLPTLDKIRGGIDSLSVTSAIATTDTDVYTTGTVIRNKPYYFDNQGDTTTLPAITSVKSISTANATDTLSSTKDYATFTDSASDYKSGIIILSTATAGGATGISTQSLRIKYVYSAIQSRKLTSGGLDSISDRWFRLTNKEIVSGTAKYRYIVIYSGSLNAGLNLNFKSSNETDPVLEDPISIIAKLDTTRTAGDQLFYIEDEVGVS